MVQAMLETVLRRAAVVAMACCVSLPVVDQAAARDDGVLEFFSSMGEGSATSGLPSAATTDDASQERPLTIRPHRHPRMAVAAVPVKPGKVAILEDSTLRRGDAVMMPEGLRIFVGSTAGPHTSKDFVALGHYDGEVSPAAEKVLATLDRRPGG